MVRKTSKLTKFLTWSSRMAGRPSTFIFAFAFVIIWMLIGIIWGFSDTWMLIINTVATINASLMVFIIQNTQNRESKALHIKIDELIRASKEATNEMIAIEEKEEEELEELRKQIFRSKEKTEGK